ncbi:efflux RND transporter periplasmic adaptor subunit [Dysgonomonas sp. 520]|uniref:efflux RND transporter periplasmic adaptor subunit n=1 Tax=Dysgonomonas sp. 520 TaxID=2302931 RepID=UPI0013D0FA20|nr:efflux RND transporter periplasmic adaptor subunit [Dysgonomonas sp. 520]NDW09312.1 efflux RND transporter periplasmic adaptor subunit [Dysgonomonas sp. 520]
MNIRYNIIIPAIIISFLSCGNNDSFLPEVEVENVEMENIPTYGEYDGQIDAYSNVEIHARVEGFLQRITFTEGQKVKRGEPLFYIDNEMYKAKVERAKAQLQKDEAQQNKAARDLERIRPLYEQNAASELDVDNATAALNVARANVAMSKADLKQAEMQLSYTVIYSPISGYIGERHVDIGSLVGGANTLLASVINRDTVTVYFNMTSLEYLNSERRNVHLGRQDTTRSWQPMVTVTLADNTEYGEKGIVDFASPQIDPETGTFRVRATLPNPNQDLLPGQKTKVKLLMNMQEDIVWIPSGAVMTEDGESFVYVVNDEDIIEIRKIETGKMRGDKVRVISGLNNNQKVVIHSVDNLDIREGGRVKPHLRKKK